MGVRLVARCGFAQFGVWSSVPALIAFLLLTAPARAQINPNIQTQANILFPPITTVPLSPAKVTSVSAAGAKILKAIDYPKELCPPTEKQIENALVSVMSATKFWSAAKELSRGRLAPMETLNANAEAADKLATAISSDPLLKARFKQAIIPPNFKYYCGQPTTLKASLQFNPTYETDALKTGYNTSPDGSIDFNGGVLATTGVGQARPYDLIFFNAQGASARYVTYSSKSLDTITAQAAYQYFIDGYFYNNGTPVAINRDHIPPTSAVTFDVASFGVVNQTLFTPGFRYQSADLFTPQITLARQNFDLTGPGKTCETSTRATASQNFCYYMDLSLTAGQTFADVPSLANLNFAAAATVGTRFNYTDWSLAGQAIVTSRSYENVPGGRQDFLIQAGPVLTYSTAPQPLLKGSTTSQSLSFSLPISYFQNFSTVSKDAWGGFIIQPTLTIAFQPPPRVN
ncbi:MAG: hypothetical protein ACLPX7_16920 [Xanthobacteraceae bacterium]